MHTIKMRTIKINVLQIVSVCHLKNFATARGLSPMEEDTQFNPIPHTSVHLDREEMR